MKVLTLSILALLLVGCNDTPRGCKTLKYSGMAISNLTNSQILCSNGDLSPDGKSYMTSQGNVPIDTVTILKFTKDQK